MGRISKKQKIYIEFYIKAFGIKTRAAELTEIDRRTYYRWMENDAFAAAIEEADEKIQDNVESAFIKTNLADRIEAQKFWLERRHPKYKPKQDIDINQPILIKGQKP